MTKAEDIAFVARLLDAYAANAWRMGVVADGPVEFVGIARSGRTTDSTDGHG
jgi:hypothetical protein